MLSSPRAAGYSDSDITALRAAGTIASD